MFDDDGNPGEIPNANRSQTMPFGGNILNKRAGEISPHNSSIAVRESSSRIFRASISPPMNRDFFKWGVMPRGSPIGRIVGQSGTRPLNRGRSGLGQ